MESVNEVKEKKGFVVCGFEFSGGDGGVVMGGEIEGEEWEDIKCGLERWMRGEGEEGGGCDCIEGWRDWDISWEKEEKEL